MPQFDAYLNGLDDLGAAPADDDMLLVVDTSDTSGDAGGTPKRVSAANLLTASSSAAPLDAAPPTDVSANEAWGLPGNVAVGAVTTVAIGSLTMYYFPVLVEATNGIVLTDTQIEVTTAGTAGATGRFLIATADENWAPTALFSDQGTVAIDTTGQKAWAPALALPRGRYLFALHASATTTFRAIPMSSKDGSWFAAAGLGTNPFIIVASRSTSNPETVPVYNSLLAGSTPGLRCPLIAKWTVTDDPF